MTIKIIRDTGWIGMGSGLSIKMNGASVGKVAHKSILNIDVPSGNVQLQASQFGARSNKIHASDGDTVKLTATTWSKYSLVGIILFMLLSSSIPSTHWLRFIAIFAMIGYAISHLIIPGFHYRLSK
ncbi:hypothetical protein HYQ40_05005 [Aerococcaceae bacterium DSM 111021]|nr:hypothetical protein [Aerococcaceae bacterium DSM 111021]